MAAKPGKSTDILDAVALIVVDMQTTFLDVIEGAPAVIERCGFAIEAARALGLRVVFTEQMPAKLGATDPRLLGLVPGARVFPKTTFSALQAEGLLEYLRRHGVYHLLLVGIEIPICIYQTALHAVDSDLDVTVLSDCVTGRRLDDSLVTLEALTRAHCHLLPAEAVYYSMLGNSTHPLFSGFNSLVKRYAEAGGLDAAPPPPASREHHYERRPVLAAPEDHPEESPPDDLGADHSDASADSEPYIGRAADGAPAAASRESAEPDADDEDAPFKGADDDSGDSEPTDAEATGGADSDSGVGTGKNPVERGGQDDTGEPGRRRRGRRRGGARRRRARERRDGPPAGNGTPAQGGAAGDSGGQTDRRGDADAPSEATRPAE